MGEYAEMMLDGTCCAGCGEYLGTDNGFATYCAGCAPDFEPDTAMPGPPGKPKNRLHRCGDCGKRFRTKGAKRQHRLAKHGAAK